jgi:hypothetical protein
LSNRSISSSNHGIARARNQPSMVARTSAARLRVPYSSCAGAKATATTGTSGVRVAIARSGRAVPGASRSQTWWNSGRASSGTTETFTAHRWACANAPVSSRSSGMSISGPLTNTRCV